MFRESILKVKTHLHVRFNKHEKNASREKKKRHCSHILRSKDYLTVKKKDKRTQVQTNNEGVKTSNVLII